MQIAPEHPEAVRQTAWVGVEERLLLDRVALHTGNIAPGHPQVAPFVVADLADADCPIRNRAPMSARKAPEPVRVDLLVDLPLPGVSTEGLGEGGHRWVLGSQDT